MSPGAQQGTAREIDRRAFFSLAAAGLPLACSAFDLRQLLARNDDSPAKLSLIPRQKNPDNLEFPFTGLRSFITPNNLFYVRNHFPQPKLERKTWRLKVAGAVARELDLTHDDLRKMPSRTETALLECAGNSRAFLKPKANGVPWELGAVSNAAWTGVPLSAILERAGVDKDAVDVVLEGSDSGEIGPEPKPRGKIHFARALPLAKAKRPEVLLAYEMNREELPPAHGFPVRALVPGWFGVASVKWLRRIVVTTKPYSGFFQSIDYSYFHVSRGTASVVPLTETQVKAEIARPAAGEAVSAGMTYRVHGAAWTGESQIKNVEISSDEGKSWSAARLLGSALPYAWRLWEYSWRIPEKPGRAVLMARATDMRGHQQPATRDPNRRNYMINHILPTSVQVKASD